MKARNLALVALLALGTSATTFAATDANALRSDIKLSDNGNLNVVVNNGVATIFGYGHLIDISKAKQAALRADGIERVVVTATTIN